MTPEEFEKAILDIYKKDQDETNYFCGGSPVHYTIESSKCQKEFWKKYHISRKQFLVLFEDFFHKQPKPLSDEIYSVNVYGGPSIHFKKDNWVEVDGRHYLQIRIDFTQYRKMRSRET